jgi:hypothetical protein
MNLREFDSALRAVISPLLELERGFFFSDGTYVRDFPDQVRHVIMFDFDVQRAKAFRVILGFNSPIVSGDLPPNEAGVFGARYLSGAQPTRAPKNFPCFTKEAAIKSLALAEQYLREYGLPWMASVRSLEDAAEIAEDHYLFIKGKLYLQAGLPDRAGRYLTDHLSYLSRQEKTASVIQGIGETQDMLGRCRRDNE